MAAFLEPPSSSDGLAQLLQASAHVQGAVQPTAHPRRSLADVSSCGGSSADSSASTSARSCGAGGSAGSSASTSAGAGDGRGSVESVAASAEEAAAAPRAKRQRLRPPLPESASGRYVVLYRGIRESTPAQDVLCSRAALARLSDMSDENSPEDQQFAGMQVQGEVAVAGQSLDTSRQCFSNTGRVAESDGSPWLSFSLSCRHALRFVYPARHLGSPATSYSEDGVPAARQVGTLYVALIPVEDWQALGAEFIPALHANSRVSLKYRYVPQVEVTIPGWLPPQYLHSFVALELPDLQPTHSCDENTWQLSSSKLKALTEKLQGTSGVVAVMRDLTEHWAEQAETAINEALRAAGGTRVFPTAWGRGFQLEIPSLNTLRLAKLLHPHACCSLRSRCQQPGTSQCYCNLLFADPAQSSNGVLAKLSQTPDLVRILHLAARASDMECCPAMQQPGTLQIIVPRLFAFLRHYRGELAPLFERDAATRAQNAETRARRCAARLRAMTKRAPEHVRDRLGQSLVSCLMESLEACVADDGVSGDGVDEPMEELAELLDDAEKELKELLATTTGCAQESAGDIEDTSVEGICQLVASFAPTLAVEIVQQWTRGDRGIRVPEGIIEPAYVQEVLERMEWPLNKSRKNVLPNGKSAVPSFAIGLVTDYARGLACSSTIRTRPNLTRLLTKFATQHNPDFCFTTIQLNRDYAAALHTDRNNHGPSMGIALGSYTDGGGLWVLDETNGNHVLEVSRHVRGWPELEVGSHVKGRVLDLAYKWQRFDGNTPHEVLQFNGPRISIVYFTRRSWTNMPDEVNTRLQASGFPVPPEDYEQVATFSSHRQASDDEDDSVSIDCPDGPLFKETCDITEPIGQSHARPLLRAEGVCGDAAAEEDNLICARHTFLELDDSSSSQEEPLSRSIEGVHQCGTTSDDSFSQDAPRTSFVADNRSALSFAQLKSGIPEAVKSQPLVTFAQSRRSQAACASSSSPTASNSKDAKMVSDRRHVATPVRGCLEQSSLSFSPSSGGEDGAPREDDASSDASREVAWSDSDDEPLTVLTNQEGAPPVAGSIKTIGQAGPVTVSPYFVSRAAKSKGDLEKDEARPAKWLYPPRSYPTDAWTLLGRTRQGERGFGALAHRALSQASKEMSPSALTLLPHQLEVAFLLHPSSQASRLLIAHATGTGKTREIVAVVQNLFDSPRATCLFFPTDEVKNNFYATLLRIPNSWRDFYCEFAGIEGWQTTRDDMWDDAQMTDHSLSTFEKVIGLSGMLRSGQVQPMARLAWKNKHPSVPMPASPLRAYKYTAGGGSRAGYGRDGKFYESRMDPIFKFGYKARLETHTAQRISCLMRPISF
eukprot:TRINITY_DN17559_c0_g1_i2.p1 TRINITY_DN17559_c0_g1~~TRINITY_DN17559_c0_g1_i2.p1  ORF type:complete len:1353 (+),score=171.90 TRINITY_DN17559_c0_g1_i2:34-4059(+)